MISSIIGESTQIGIIREYMGFLLRGIPLRSLFRIVFLKIEVIAIEIFLININLVYNSNFLLNNFKFDLSKV